MTKFHRIKADSPAENDVSEAPPLEDLDDQLRSAIRKVWNQQPGLDYCIRDRWHRYVWVSECHASKFGLSAAEMVGKSTNEVHPKDFADEINNRDDLVMSERKPTSIERDPIHYPAICATRIEQTTYLPMVEGNEVVGVSCYATDVTKLRKRELELQAKEEQWRLLTEDSQAGIMIHDFKVPLFVNQSLVEMFGYTDQTDFLQRKDWQVLFADEEKTNTPHYRKRITGKTVPFVKRRFKGVKKSGETLWCEATLRFPVIWDGRQCLQATILDVTAKVVAEEEFERLTPREKEVVSRLCRGLTNKEIALDLGISHRTVEVYRSRAVSKLGVETTASLITKVGSAAKSYPD